MALIVQKYGGTSVGSVERIQNVARKVAQSRQNGHDVVVVVSAMSGVTDKLIGLAKDISARPSPREMDVLLNTGEQQTIALLAMALEAIGQPAKSYTGQQVKILTDSAHTKARIVSIDGDKIRADLADGNVVIVAGFQGADADGNLTTLGRGGSDTTGVALAAALKADECHIYTDVDGVYTTDPRIEPNARRLSRITFEEMLELASLGSKVLQIRSVEFAGKFNVPVRVLSTFQDGNPFELGTLITLDQNDMMEDIRIAGIADNKNEAQITVQGVPDRPGIAYQILGPVGDANIEVDMIVQNASAQGLTDFTFTVGRVDYDRALEIVQTEAKKMGAKTVTGNPHICKVSAVGVGMRSHAGVAAKMFKILADNGINILMISTSEIKISVAIEEKYRELAVRVLHEALIG